MKANVSVVAGRITDSQALPQLRELGNKVGKIAADSGQLHTPAEQCLTGTEDMRTSCSILQVRSRQGKPLSRLRSGQHLNHPC